MNSTPFGELVGAGAGHPQQSPCWRQVVLEELAGAAASGPLRPLLNGSPWGFSWAGGQERKTRRAHATPPPCMFYNTSLVAPVVQLEY